MTRFRIPNFNVKNDGVIPYFNLVMNKQAGSVVVYNAVKEIGNWNMHTDQTITVTFNLDINIKRIVSIHCTILNDDEDEIYVFSDGADEMSYTSANGVKLVRSNNGMFHDHNFDSSSINRGFIMVSYTT